ncbi:MAG: DUF378 domain-containing protein [Patescibacteria group bacterium]
MKGLHTISWILLIVGGLNWGLEFFGWGVGNYLPSGVANIIYLLVGLSALFEIFNHKNTCKECVKGGSTPVGQM